MHQTCLAQPVLALYGSGSFAALVRSCAEVSDASTCTTKGPGDAVCMQACAVTSLVLQTAVMPNTQHTTQNARLCPDQAPQHYLVCCTALRFVFCVGQHMLGKAGTGTCRPAMGQQTSAGSALTRMVMEMMR